MFVHYGARKANTYYDDAPSETAVYDSVEADKYDDLQPTQQRNNPVYDAYNKSENTDAKTKNASFLSPKFLVVFGIVFCLVMCILTGLMTGIIVYSKAQSDIKQLEKALRESERGWSSWSEWNGCEEACACGEKYRSRVCRVPTLSADNTSTCPGNDYDVTSCCNVDCANDMTEWRLMFRGLPMVGTDVYEAWVGQIVDVTEEADCFFDCFAHYRNPLIDYWTDLEIKRVKYSLFKRYEEAAYIEFEGTGTDMLSWFDSSKIISSSWIDIKWTKFNYFSIAGRAPGRRFYINVKNGTCMKTRDYTIAVTAKGSGCSYDRQEAYPVFIYSNTSSFGQSHDWIDFDYADYMEVSIKI